MKLIIAGTRTFYNYNLVKETLEPYKEKVTEVVCGGANGADSLGELWAKENGIKITYFLPRWDLYGKAAGHIRNREMAEYGDFLVAFWDGKSRGTASMIHYMEELNKHGEVINYEDSMHIK